MVTPADNTGIYDFTDWLTSGIINENSSSKPTWPCFYIDTYSTKNSCPFSSVSCSHPYGKSETQERLTAVCVVEWSQAKPQGQEEGSSFFCTLNSLDQLPRVTRFKGGGYRRPSIPSGMHISASDLAKILLHSWPPFSVHSVAPLPASLSSCSCEREFLKTATTSAGTADTEQWGADLCHGLKRPITYVYQLICLHLDPKPIEAKQLQRLLFLFNTFIPRIVCYLFGST